MKDWSPENERKEEERKEDERKKAAEDDILEKERKEKVRKEEERKKAAEEEQQRQEEEDEERLRQWKGQKVKEEDLEDDDIQSGTPLAKDKIISECFREWGLHAFIFDVLCTFNISCFWVLQRVKDHWHSKKT